MIDVLWNVFGCIGLVALALTLIGTCILLVCGIICIVKQAKEESQYMLGKIMEYMFGGFLIVFTGILMIALIALIVWLIIDFIKNGA